MTDFVASRHRAIPNKGINKSKSKAYDDDDDNNINININMISNKNNNATGKPPMSPTRSQRSTSPVRRFYGRIPAVITCRVPDRLEGFILGTTGSIDSMDELEWGTPAAATTTTTTAKTSSSSSCTVQTMTISEEFKAQEEEEQQRSDKSELLSCLNLLESNLLNDNRYGMERLMKLVNYQLVNGIPMKGSVAEALVCGIGERKKKKDKDDHDEDKTEKTSDESHDSTYSLVAVSTRLQQVFLSYLSDDYHHCSYPYFDGISDCSDSSHSDDDSSRSSFSSSSSSASSSYFEYDDVEDDLRCDMKITNGKHSGSLKLPALRILASALELLVNDQKRNGRPTTTNDDANKNKQKKKDDGMIVDLTSFFWKKMLESISNIVEATTSYRIEATFSIRCIRLLRYLQPTEIDSYIKYSLLPFVMHAHDYGEKKKDKILIREAQSILKPLMVSSKQSATTITKKRNNVSSSSSYSSSAFAADNATIITSSETVTSTTSSRI